jgi:hypothetical protein
MLKFEYSDPEYSSYLKLVHVNWIHGERSNPRAPLAACRWPDCRACSWVRAILILSSPTPLYWLLAAASSLQPLATLSQGRPELRRIIGPCPGRSYAALTHVRRNQHRTSVPRLLLPSGDAPLRWAHVRRSHLRRPCLFHILSCVRTCS